MQQIQSDIIILRLLKEPTPVRAHLMTAIQTLKITSLAALLNTSQTQKLLYGAQRDLANGALVERLQAELNRMKRGEITLIGYFNPAYPQKLRMIPNAPLGFFVRGIIPEKFPPAVAIVGSRGADREGRNIACRFAEEIVSQGVCVVSGLALGVDGAAHEGALRFQSSFPTVAVLGNGIDGIYPASHRNLGMEIIERGGALISEYMPGTPAYPSNFLGRNRIIAALSEGVLIVQSAPRSGALSTARYGLEYGKEIYAIPWDLNHPYGGGCLRLLQQGAHLVTSAGELLNDLYDMQINKSAKVDLQKLTSRQQKIVATLNSQIEVHYDELLNRCNEEESSWLPTDILELETLNIVERMPGNIYRVVKS